MLFFKTFLGKMFFYVISGIAVDTWLMQRLGMLTPLHSQKSIQKSNFWLLKNLLNKPTKEEKIHLRYYIYWKHPRISTLTQFKSMLLKGQLQLIKSHKSLAILIRIKFHIMTNLKAKLTTLSPSPPTHEHGISIY